MNKTTIIMLFLAILILTSISFVSPYGDKSKVYDPISKKIAILDKNKTIEAQYQLLSNECDKKFRFCNATIETNFYKNITFHNSIYFYKDIYRNISGKVRWVKIYYYTKNEKIEVNDYKIECILINGNQECHNILAGTHKENTPEWTEYKGESFLGKKTWLIVAEKRPSWTIDWVLSVVDNIKLMEWAVWGNISDGDEAEVILNSPVNNTIDLDGTVTFNATANITAVGSYIINMSLWTNQSGSWTRVNTSTYTGTNALNFNDSTEYLLDPAPYNKNYDIPDSFVSYVLVDLKTNANVLVTFNYDGGSSWNTPTQLSTSSYETKNYTNPNSSLVVTSITVDSDTGVYSKNFLTYGYNYSNSWTNTFTRILSNTSVWGVEVCDTDGVCGFSVYNNTIKMDFPNISIINPTNGTSAFVTINATILANGTLQNCSYNITKGVNTDKATTFINCSQFNDTHSLTLNTGDYIITVFANTTTGFQTITTKSFTYSSSGGATGGGGGGGTIIEKLENVADVNFCKGTDTTFSENWKALRSEWNWTNFKKAWYSLWNHSFCVSTASLVPFKSG